METCIQQMELPNGLTISVYDSTRRYYEDYHLVRLEFICPVPLRMEHFSNPEAFDEAKKLLGEAAVYRRTCEKMGVPFDEIAVSRNALIADFMKNALPYFTMESFPGKLVRSELQKARGNVARVRV